MHSTPAVLQIRRLGAKTGRLEVDRVTAAAVFTNNTHADTTLVTLTLAETGQRLEVGFATYSCAGHVPKHYILESGWAQVSEALGEVRVFQVHVASSVAHKDPVQASRCQVHLLLCGLQPSQKP